MNIIHKKQSSFWYERYEISKPFFDGTITLILSNMIYLVLGPTTSFPCVQKIRFLPFSFFFFEYLFNIPTFSLDFCQQNLSNCSMK